ncbi:MAG: hypothetical protein KA369_15725 [Spirochaetes bacterium]|nr:hypothetical protein [Spirochaetota bacterium]
MNVKMLNCITASALLFAVLYPLYSIAAGKEEKCPARRPLTASEKSSHAAALRTIRAALAPAPEGWIREEPIGGDPSSICEDPGFPMEWTLCVTYSNEKKVLENIRNFGRGPSAGKAARLAAEMSDAAERDDSKKLRKLQEELDALGAVPAGALTARITVRINPAKTAGNIRGGDEFQLPGAKYAYLMEEKKKKRLVLYLGRWNRRGEFSILPEAVKDRSNVSAQMMEIIIEGDASEDLARAMDLKALNALME